MAGAKVMVSDKTKELIENPDFTEWTLEELVRGQRRSRTGRWHGKPPKVIPHALLMELNRRITPEVHKKLLQAARDGAEYLRAVNAGEVEANAIRFQAATYAVNRLLGMPGQRVHLDVTVGESEYAKAGVKKAIVLRDFETPDDQDVIDVESWENPFAPDEDDPFGSDQTVSPHTPAEATPEVGNPIVEGRPTETDAARKRRKGKS